MICPLTLGDFSKCWIADVSVDNRDRRTREITESEAEVDNHGRDRDVVTRRYETHDADSFVVNSSRNSRACGFDVTHGRVVELDADRCKESIVSRDIGTVWHR